MYHNGFPQKGKEHTTKNEKVSSSINHLGYIPQDSKKENKIKISLSLFVVAVNIARFFKLLV